MKKHLFTFLASVTLLAFSLVTNPIQAESLTPYGDNLLTNPNCDSNDFVGWTKIGAGSGWKAENNEWMSSNGLSEMRQTVDLLTAGFTAEQLDVLPVLLAAGSFSYPYGYRDTPSGIAKIIVYCLGSDNATLQALVLKDTTTIAGVVPWDTYSDEIQLPVGTRKLQFYFAGKDNLGWAGHYGPKFDNMWLSIGSLPSYNVACASVDNGTFSVDNPTAFYGDTVTISVNPAANYGLKAFNVTNANNESITVAADSTFIMPVGYDVTISGEFWPIEGLSLTCASVPNGTFSVANSTANYGDTVTISVNPAANYGLKAFNVTNANNENIMVAADSTFIMPAGFDVTISGEFWQTEGFSLTCASVPNGTLSVANSTVNMGDTVKITVIPAANYGLKAFNVTNANNESITVAADSTFIMPVRSDVTISGEFWPTEGLSLTCASVPNGTFSVDNFTANYGDTVTISVNPAANYGLKAFNVTNANNENIMVAVDSTFIMPAGFDVTISGEFGPSNYLSIACASFENGTSKVFNSTVAYGEKDTLSLIVENIADFSSNYVLRNPSYFSEDFEGDLSNWDYDGTWSITDEQGIFALSENASGNYSNKMSQSITMKNAVQVINGDSAFLSYSIIGSTETDYDYITTKVQVNNGEWQEIDKYSGTFASWTKHRLDLSSYVQKGDVLRMGFAFTTDGSSTKAGVRIDSIKVSGGTYVSPASYTSTLASLARDTVEIIFDSKGLLPDLYQTAFVIQNNDALLIPDTVYSHFTVGSVSIIEVSDSSLAFDSTFVAGIAKDTLIITNIGNDTLRCDFSKGNNAFKMNMASLILAPFSSQEMELTFEPTTVGTFTDSVTISSNGGEDITIALSGKGVSGPEFVLATDTLVASAEYGEKDTVLFVVENDGGNELSYDLSVETYDAKNTQSITQSGEDMKHLFTNIPSSIDSLSILITLDGDYDANSEYADLYLNNYKLGQSDNFNNSISKTFVYNFAIVDIQGEMSYDSLWIRIDNSKEVDPGYGNSITTVQVIGKTNFISLEKTSGLVTPNAKDTVAIVFDSENLLPGLYLSHLIVQTNDPLQQCDTVTTHFTVGSAAIIEVSDSSLAFDSTFVAGIAKDTLIITNTGNDTLRCDFSKGNNAFKMNMASLILAPFSSQEMELTFEPTTVGTFTDSVPISSNGGEDITIALSGKGVSGPELVLATDTLVASAEYGEKDTVLFVVENDGSNELSYDLSVETYDAKNTQSITQSGEDMKHLFTNIPSSIDSLSILITLDGDYDGSTEYADLYLNNYKLGQSDNFNNNVSKTFVYNLAIKDIQGEMSYDSLWIRIDNSNGVDPGYGNSITTVQVIGKTSFISLEKTSGLVTPNAKDTVAIVFDSENLSAGSYLSTLVIETNDPLHLSDTIVCNFIVSRRDGNISWSLQDSTLEMYCVDTLVNLPQATTSISGSMISYLSSDTSIVHVNSISGILDIRQAGSVTITALAASTDSCNAVSAIMTLNVQENWTWSLADSIISKIMGDSSFVLLSAVSAIESATIVYHSDDETIATIDAISGELSIVGIGTCTISAVFTADGCAEESKSLTLEVGGATALDQVSAAMFTIYPNPASVEARVSGIDCELIEVYSLAGQKLLEVKNSPIIPVSGLSSGTYIINVNGFTQQLLVK